jgi:hypothetical protein
VPKPPPKRAMAARREVGKFMAAGLDCDASKPTGQAGNAFAANHGTSAGFPLDSGPRRVDYK